MGDADTEWRLNRLQAAIDDLDDGNVNAFARRLGLRDGSYIRQLLRGARPINEKVIFKIEEAIPQLNGWFDRDQHASVESALEQKVRTELLKRQVPEHVLLTMLDLVTHCPLRKKAA